MAILRGDPRFPSAEEVAAQYGRASGAELDDVAFFVALGFFKLAVIAEGVHRRYVDGDTLGEGFATMGAAVEPLLDRGLDVLAEGGAGLF